MEKFALDAELYEVQDRESGARDEEAAAFEREAAAWESGRPKPASIDPMPEAVPACREYAATVPLPPLGRGSEKEFRRRIEVVLDWARRKYSPDRGSFQNFAMVAVRAAWARFCGQFRAVRLQAELSDQNIRDSLAPEVSEDGLLFYLDFAEDQIREALRRRRFGARTEREEDLIADTRVKIIETVRRGQRPFPFAKYEHPGVPAALAIFDEVRGTARRHQRLVLVGNATDWLAGRSPSPEEALLEMERRQLLAALPGKLAHRLTKRQQAWLDAFRAEAEDGDWILARAAQRRGLHRSQATRAADRIAATARRYKLLADIIDVRDEAASLRASPPGRVAGLSPSPPAQLADSAQGSGTSNPDPGTASIPGPIRQTCEHDPDPDRPCRACRFERAEVGRWRNRKGTTSPPKRPRR